MTASLRSTTFRLPAAALLAAAAVVVFFSQPFAWLILCCLVLATAPERHTVWLLGLAASATFLGLNLLKELQGDFVYYVDLQAYLANQPASVLLDEAQLRLVSASYRVTEIGFYGPLWVLAQIFPGDRSTVAIAATLGIYVTTMCGLLIIARHQRWSEGLTLTVILFVFFASINFVQTTHLLRQYVASSFVFLAFACIVAGRRPAALCAALYACTIHNGALLLVASLVALAVLFPPGIFSAGRRWSLALRVLGGFGILALSFGLGMLGLLEGITAEESAQIGVVHYVGIGALFLVYMLASARGAGEGNFAHYVALAFISIYVISLGFFLLGIGLFALRYFAYLEWLFGLMLATILMSLPHRRWGIDQFARWGLCLVALAVFVVRLRGSPWAYAGEHEEVLGRSLFFIINAAGS